MAKIFFITATDTGVGKTMTTLALAALFKSKGYKVAVMKPVQCAGDDIQMLSRKLNITENQKTLNPFFAPEPLSPHLALKRAKIKFKLSKVKKALKKLRSAYDIILIEGAGGIMVPLSDEYYIVDLIQDLNVPVIIVSRLGLGTINHTLLTINEAKLHGLNIQGIIFSQSRPRAQSIPEKTNPAEIQKLSGVRVLGTVPYFKKTADLKTIAKQCAHLKLPL